MLIFQFENLNEQFQKKEASFVAAEHRLPVDALLRT
jgi:hypothetical protein